MLEERGGERRAVMDGPPHLGTGVQRCCSRARLGEGMGTFLGVALSIEADQLVTHKLFLPGSVWPSSSLVAQTVSKLFRTFWVFSEGLQQWSENKDGLLAR